ncbi:MAG TPA: hypothetical protein VNQ50_07175 [Xanthobacteraceae bacterium]|jgi:ABC-2 type transport system ATP-binding protein|nr:hypothetical protein [Xanthobacteraceae bacterium]
MHRTVFRRTMRHAAMSLSLLLGVTLAAAPAGAACTGDHCRAAASTKAKPLNLMRFMDQGPPAAGARKATPQRRTGSHARRAQSKKRATAKATTQTKPTVTTPDSVADAAATDESAARTNTDANADRSEPAVQVVDAGEFNDIDRKADEAPSSTAGEAAADAIALSDSDQTAESQARRALAEAARAAAAQAAEAQAAEAQAAEAQAAEAQAQQTEPAQAQPRARDSWIGWAWSLVESTAVAVATAIHALIG